MESSTVSLLSAELLNLCWRVVADGTNSLNDGMVRIVYDAVFIAHDVEHGPYGVEQLSWPEQEVYIGRLPKDFITQRECFVNQHAARLEGSDQIAQ